MRKNDIKGLRTKTTEELKNLAESKGHEIAKLIVINSTKKEKNTHIIKAKKKDLARILTIIKEMEPNSG